MFLSRKGRRRAKQVRIDLLLPTYTTLTGRLHNCFFCCSFLLLELLLFGRGFFFLFPFSGLCRFLIQISLVGMVWWLLSRACPPFQRKKFKSNLLSEAFGALCVSKIGDVVKSGVVIFFHPFSIQLRQQSLDVCVVCLFGCNSEPDSSFACNEGGSSCEQRGF
ncbi:hypothetical protein IWX91DRAFT_58479 [Phyllosticta citricarpa]